LNIELRSIRLVEKFCSLNKLHLVEENTFATIGSMARTVDGMTESAVNASDAVENFMISRTNFSWGTKS
jgi:hypothetical protein